ncbi:MAG: hypothetical protein ACXVGF_04875 [Blastococcus sp.]
MTLFGCTIPQIRKALVAAAGILGTLLTANLLPPDWSHWVSTIAGILTVCGTYVVPNAPSAADVALARGRHEAGLRNGPTV